MPQLRRQADAPIAKPSISPDIVIVGAGVAGVSAAAAFSNSGFAVTLVDSQPVFPPAFRAEKIGDPQMEFFDQFGLGEAAHDAMTRFDGVWIHRFGRIADKLEKREYASPYGDLINALRAALPANVRFVYDSVSDVRTGEVTQTVGLRGGETLDARLLILATGLGQAVSRKLGITRVTRSSQHSLACGFDVERSPSEFPFPSLIWLSDRPADRMAYFSLFPMAGTMRANLFLYRTLDDLWCRRFREEPEAALNMLMPKLESTFGPIVPAGTPQVRPTDLTVAVGFRQPGVVLVGDAFCTTCPVTGTGMHKALNDVDVLRRHVPDWFATPGMAADKIARFYGDPAKEEVDAGSLRFAMTERAIRLDNSLEWRVRRLRRSLMRRAHYAAKALLPAAVMPATWKVS